MKFAKHPRDVPISPNARVRHGWRWITTDSGISRASFISLVHICSLVCICDSRFHAAGHLPAGSWSRSLRGELQRTGDVCGAVRRALRHQERFQWPWAVTSHTTSAGLCAHLGPNAALQHARLGHDGVRTTTGQSQYRQALQPVLPVRQCDEGTWRIFSSLVFPYY